MSINSALYVLAIGMTLLLVALALWRQEQADARRRLREQEMHGIITRLRDD